jgi:hypothetical protein
MIIDQSLGQVDLPELAGQGEADSTAFPID